MAEIKYAVIELYLDEFGVVTSTILRDYVSEIKEAESHRLSYIEDTGFDPQNVQVVSYKL